jgi:hypothetical protein
MPLGEMIGGLLVHDHAVAVHFLLVLLACLSALFEL